MILNFVDGDATEPPVSPDTVNIILHCVNDTGVMGSGIALAIRNKFPSAYDAYKALFIQQAISRATAQGQLQLIYEENKDLFVANLFGQSMTGHFHGLPAVRYEAVEEGLIRLCLMIEKRKQKEKAIHIHTCRLCSGLAGGSWAKIEEIIQRVFAGADVVITVYDPPGSTFNP